MDPLAQQGRRPRAGRRGTGPAGTSVVAPPRERGGTVTLMAGRWSYWSMVSVGSPSSAQFLAVSS